MKEETKEKDGEGKEKTKRGGVRDLGFNIMKKGESGMVGCINLLMLYLD